jgi:hypothetical protein
LAEGPGDALIARVEGRTMVRCFLCGCDVDPNEEGTWFYPGDRVACPECEASAYDGEDDEVDDFDDHGPDCPCEHCEFPPED